MAHEGLGYDPEDLALAPAGKLSLFIPSPPLPKALGLPPTPFSPFPSPSIPRWLAPVGRRRWGAI